MPYAVKQDLIDRFGERELVQVTNPETPDAEAIDDTVLTRALSDADAEIDGYLIGRYELPFDTAPAVLVRSACDIARYHLYDDRVTEQVQRRYDDVVKFLAAVSKGDISLGVDVADAPTSGGAQSSGGSREFTRAGLSDY